MSRDYGRSLKGERVYQAKRKRPKQNEKYTWVSALCTTGLFAHCELQGSMTGDAFLFYVTDILIPELKQHQVVIMDNLSCHKTPAILDAFHKAGRALVFLPPYSPDLSPIEECWSKFKASLKKWAARTQDDLITATQLALDSISQTDIIGWFRHFQTNIQ